MNSRKYFICSALLLSSCALYETNKDFQRQNNPQKYYFEEKRTPTFNIEEEEISPLQKWLDKERRLRAKYV